MIEALKTPFRIERYFILWSIYAFWIVLKSVIMIPLDITLSIINSMLSILQVCKTKRVTFFSILICIELWILLQDHDIRLFDISYLYHTFRGQSTLKLYGLMFALEVSEKLMTMTGQYLL